MLWREILFCSYFEICSTLTLQVNGFSPAPMDLHNVTLSRELQVGFHLSLGWCCPTCPGSVPYNRSYSFFVWNTNENEMLNENVQSVWRALVLVFVQGMVEVVAENYHNIWAKKKKTELISKGLQTDTEHFTWTICEKSLCFTLIWPDRRRDPPTAGALWYPDG